MYGEVRGSIVLQNTILNYKDYYTLYSVYCILHTV